MFRVFDEQAGDFCDGRLGLDADGAEERVGFGTKVDVGEAERVERKMSVRRAIESRVQLRLPG